MGKFPYACKICSSEYALRKQYDAHMQKHLIRQPAAEGGLYKDTITLDDLSMQDTASYLGSSFDHSGLTIVAPKENDEDYVDEQQLDYKCDLCPRSFNSSHGLSRHRVRKHDLRERKKYFIKVCAGVILYG